MIFGKRLVVIKSSKKEAHMLKQISLHFCLLFLLLISQSSFAATTLVAVAANFIKPMTEIVAEFEKATGHSANLSFGSTGKFVSQMENGAPFEILLAADEKSPEKLIKDGFAVSGSQFIYAQGKLALWSATPGYVDNQGKILNSGGFKHLALADPKLAPYGVAAIEVLNSLQLQEMLSPLIVQGESIAQTYQFISSGNAELGFVALSQVFENGKITSGSAWLIPAELHAPIKQAAVLLKIGSENPAAIALLAYLKSAPALDIIQKYGYDLAN